MNKKGQMFIFGGIVIIILIFMLTATYNTAREIVTLGAFDELVRNHQIESNKVLNKAVLEGKDVTAQIVALEDFTTRFLEYGRQTDPNFGIIYVHKDPSTGAVFILNALTKKKIKIKPKGGAKLKDVNLLSKDGESKGSICLGGIGCTSATATMDKYGRQTYATTFANVDEMCINIVGVNEKDCIKINLKQFTNSAIIESEEVVADEEFENGKGIKVSVVSQ